MTLRYSAAIVGWGSEVLGFDTPTSRDRLQYRERSDRMVPSN